MFCGRDCLAQPLYIISWHHLIIYLTCTLYVYTQNESAVQELLGYLQNVLLISSCFCFIILRAFNLILKLLGYFSHLGFMFKHVLILILNFPSVQKFLLCFGFWWVIFIIFIFLFGWFLVSHHSLVRVNSLKLHMFQCLALENNLNKF